MNSKTHFHIISCSAKHAFDIIEQDEPRNIIITSGSLPNFEVL